MKNQQWRTQWFLLFERISRLNTGEAVVPLCQLSLQVSQESEDGNQILPPLTSELFGLISDRQPRNRGEVLETLELLSRQNHQDSELIAVARQMLRDHLESL